MKRFLAALLVSVGLAAQEPVIVPVVDDPLAVDGRLDEAFWASAVVCRPFHVLGKAAQPSTLRCEALLAVQSGDLCIGYRLEEPEPEAIRTSMTQSIAIYHDDCVETFLSPDRDGHRLVHLLVNARGNRHWEQRSGAPPSPTWYPMGLVAGDGRWAAQAAIDRFGRCWTAEMRICLQDVVGSTVSGRTRLYLNLTRHRPRGSEMHMTWAPMGGGTYLDPQAFLPVEVMLPASVEAASRASARLEVTNQLTIPDLLLPGVPVRILPRTGVHRLPGAWIFTDVGVAISETVRSLMAERSVIPGRPPATCRLAVSPEVFADPALSAEERRLLEVPEAFRLEFTDGRVDIAGRTRDGVLRGLASYAMIAARTRAGGADPRALVVYDAPRMPFRAWHLTVTRPAARLREVLDAAFLLRLNHVLISVDSFDGDTPFPFTVASIGDPSRTTAEWVEAFAYARERGIEPIPYLASWGRTQYITRKKEYRHLQTPELARSIQPKTRNLDVANPEAVALMLALQGELVEKLRPKALCVGFDEVNYADMIGSPMAQANRWKPSDWIVAALTANANFLRSKGVEMLVWGDMFDPGQNGRYLDQTGPDLLARLPQDMTILDWKYEGSFDRATEFPSIAMFKDSGRRTVGCPWFQPNNIARMARSVQIHGADGLCLTSWNGTNLDQLPPELARALGLTAWLAWSPGDGDLARLPLPPEALLRFAGPAGHPGLSPPGVARALPLPADAMVTGVLAEFLGLPAGSDLGAVHRAAASHRGVVLSMVGGPDALLVRGGVAVVGNGSFARGLDGWVVQPGDTEGLFTANDGVLIVRRDPRARFQRIFQDVRLPGGSPLRLRWRYRALRGGGVVYVYPGDGRRWDEGRIMRSAKLEAGEWTTAELALPVAADTALRICVAVEGKDAEICFDDMELYQAEEGRSEALAGMPATILVNEFASKITFLHACCRQRLSMAMHDNVRRYAGTVAGIYVVAYADGGEEVIPLNFRKEVTSLDDTCLGREQDPGIFGTLAGSTFVNLPTFTWRNPWPDRKIIAIRVLPGNRRGVDLAVFGVYVEP